MSKTHDTSKLDDLIVTLIDSVKGYAVNPSGLLFSLSKVSVGQ